MINLDRGPVPLNKFKVYDKFIPGEHKSTSFTFSCYILPVPGDKTIKASKEMHMNPPVFGWDGVFYFTQESDGKTVLSVNTVNNTTNDSTKYLKILCPPLLSQKWTYVSVVIEGRRFTVLYNGKIVASKIIGEMPTVSSKGTFFTGNYYDQAHGQVAYVAAVGRAMTSEEILIEYASTSNTRGEPYLSGTFFDMFGCPAGLFCMQRSLPIPKPGIMAWSTPFA